jgi:alkylation response protein AidB-like acyl-CoA dehydrogenase
MQVGVTTEQRELAAVVRSFLDARAPEAVLRRLLDDDLGWEPDTWSTAAHQLGLHGLAIPEAFGGSGFGAVELGVCFEQTGRVLWSAPFFSTVGLAAPLLLALADDDVNKEYLPGIAAGELTATVALSEADGGWDPERVTTRAERGPHGWTLTGDKAYVPDGHAADLLLVVARTPHGGTGVFAVDGADAPGLDRRRVRSLDPTRRLGTVSLRNTPGRLVGDHEPGLPGLRRALDVSAALLAAEQVGGTARVLEMAVAYARDRHQFGRPIGSFQAVKHRCAGMLVALEGARSAAYAALHAVAVPGPDGDHGLARAASLARSFCSEAYTRAAADNLHVHGGIGMTWEHPAHLYLKRARSSEQILGAPSFHRRRLSTLIWAPTASAS